MNGLELLQHVRQISPKTKTILVTAYGSDDVWERARQLDISRGLSKPVKINVLLATVKELLAQTSPSLSCRMGSRRSIFYPARVNLLINHGRPPCLFCSI
jgi:DNA-binding NarL/FixJ family response regulator